MTCNCYNPVKLVMTDRLQLNYEHWLRMRNKPLRACLYKACKMISAKMLVSLVEDEFILRLKTLALYKNFVDYHKNEIRNLPWPTGSLFPLPPPHSRSTSSVFPLTFALFPLAFALFPLAFAHVRPLSTHVHPLTFAIFPLAFALSPLGRQSHYSNLQRPTLTSLFPRSLGCMLSTRV